MLGLYFHAKEIISASSPSTFMSMYFIHTATVDTHHHHHQQWRRLIGDAMADALLVGFAILVDEMRRMGSFSFSYFSFFDETTSVM